MAKKKKKKAGKSGAIDRTVLPQNILPKGERVEADKAVYICRDVYREILRFSENKTERECGGVLVGYTVEALGKTNIILCGFIEAKFSEGTPTTLKFTHKSWEYIHAETAKRFPDLKIMGWIHTHPDFGVFLSEYDVFIQESVFSDENQVALVVDPIRREEGFYFWLNGRIERCKGYFLFDAPGVELRDEPPAEPVKVDPVRARLPAAAVCLLAAMAIAIAALISATLLLNNRLNDVQKQFRMLEDSANQAIAVLQQQMQSLYYQMNGFPSAPAASEETPSGETEPEETPADPAAPAGEEEGASETQQPDGGEEAQP